MSSSAPETPISAESLLPEELLASPGFLLARVGGGMKMRELDELEEAGCPGFQYGVLALLREGPAQTQARIADVLGVDRSQLVGELDALEAAGLLGVSDAAALRAGYSFLRLVEARLRVVTDRPLTEVPESADDKAKLARRLGFDSPGRFLDELKRVTGEVRRLYQAITAKEGG